MCAYRGKEIADLCKAISQAEHEVEELLRVNAKHSQLPAKCSREVLVRSGDRRALAALDRLLRDFEYGQVPSADARGDALQTATITS